MVLAKPPTVNGSTGPARLRVGVPSSRPGFSSTWLSGNKLATKSFFSHFRASMLARTRQMSTPQVGTRCLHLSMGGSSRHLTRFRGTSHSVLLFLGLSTWDRMGHKVLQRILRRPVVRNGGQGFRTSTKRKRSGILVVCGQQV